MTLAQKRNELRRLEEEYKQMFWRECVIALVDNELTGNQTIYYPDSIPPQGYAWRDALPKKYEGTFDITENYVDRDIPFRLHFKSDRKAEGGVIPVYQKIFVPTVENLDNLTKWAKETIYPLFRDYGHKD